MNRFSDRSRQLDLGLSDMQAVTPREAIVQHLSHRGLVVPEELQLNVGKAVCDLAHSLDSAKRFIAIGRAQTIADLQLPLANAVVAAASPLLAIPCDGGVHTIGRLLVECASQLMQDFKLNDTEREVLLNAATAAFVRAQSK